MATIIEVPKLAIIADPAVTSPSARFAVLSDRLSGPTHLDGGSNTTTFDLLGGNVLWIDKRACSFALELVFPSGATEKAVTCTGDPTVSPTWSANTATLTFLEEHETNKFAVTCSYRPSQDSQPDEVTITVRVRRGTGSVFGNELAAPGEPRG